MTKYSICHNNHVLVADEDDSGICPNCGSYAKVLARYEVKHKLMNASYSYATGGTALDLHQIEHWSKVLITIRKMEKDHA